jgi:hypothetical protein
MAGHFCNWPVFFLNFNNQFIHFQPGVRLVCLAEVINQIQFNTESIFTNIFSIFAKKISI